MRRLHRLTPTPIKAATQTTAGSRRSGRARRRGAAAAGMAAALALTACGGGDEPGGGDGDGGAAQDADQVSVILDFLYDASFGPLAYGVQQEVFADNGVELEVIPGRGGDLAMQQINAGEVDFAFTDLSVFMQQRIKGETDTTAVYAWIPDPQICIASLEPLSSPQDMAGKTFATVSFSSGRTTVPYVLEQNGVDVSTVEVQLLDIAVLIPQLLQGAVDTAESAIPGSFESNEITAETAGQELYCTLLSDWGYRDYGKLLVVGNDLIENDPDLVQRVVGAFNESMQSALADASGQDIFDALRQVEPQIGEEEVLRSWERNQVMETAGPIETEVVEYLIDFLEETAGLTTDLSPEDFYDNSFFD